MTNVETLVFTPHSPLSAEQHKIVSNLANTQINRMQRALHCDALQFASSRPSTSRSLSSIMDVSEEPPAPIGTLFPELAKALSDESFSLQTIEEIAGGDGDMVLSLRKHKMVAIPPYTMYVVSLFSR